MMSDELKPGTEEFAQRLTELTTTDLIFYYKQEPSSYGKDSPGIAILKEAKRRDAERQRLIAEVADLTAKLRAAHAANLALADELDELDKDNDADYLSESE